MATPMLKQYQSIRATLDSDTVLFFRMGDFYEMFFEDAGRASSILDITLTARDGGEAGKVPMCGVPYHAAQGYINRLNRAGLKVAVCEQIEDPAQAKGLVRREVVRMVSPGTNLDDDSDGDCNYIAAVHRLSTGWGCAALDLGTGDFVLCEHTSAADMADELLRLRPTEMVLTDSGDRTPINGALRELHAVMNDYEDWVFDRTQAEKRLRDQFRVQSLGGFGIESAGAALNCAGALLYYLQDNMHTALGHLKAPRMLQHGRHMRLDRQTLRNLELISPASGDSRAPTLYSVLNQTLTPMGARLLAAWLVRPLIDAAEIRERLNAVETLTCKPDTLQRIRRLLQPVRDLERLLGRITCGTPSARNLIALAVSLRSVPGLKESATGLDALYLRRQFESLHELQDVADLIEAAIVDQPPPGVRDGGFVRAGYSAELDELRGISTNARDWIAALQKKEAEKTGIKSLKIKYNRVFGYYIDVTKANLHLVPDYYIRRQTLVNSERFIVPELKAWEEKILGADERADELELRIYEQVRAAVLERSAAVQQTAAAVAVVDVLACLALCAVNNRYCKPEISDSPTIYIAGGRHPVVEQSLEKGAFVENDVHLDNAANQLLIITGPNMAGKSTFIRQVAHIALMAQIGSFVPARTARMGVVDRVFSRIGASDNLARGESTFMVEMIETANILHNATSRSLLVFDEIGRGTSTFDGVSIAWSVCEFLSRPGFAPKCLFATHYHELTELADHRAGIRNYTVSVKEIEDRILFLRTVVPGSADRSYGIHVGKLAGLPREIIERAEEILLCLEEEKISEESISQILKKKKKSGSLYDLPLFQPLRAEHNEHNTQELVRKALADHPVLRKLSGLDINALTPLQALSLLADLTRQLNEDPCPPPAPER
jgi:DNA mismatch repair protein MutS